MRRYETITILDPDLGEEDRTALCGRLTDRISQQDGLLVEFDDWGNRKLAYEIKKKPRGHYVRLDYCGVGALVDEMERYMRITDGFLKYLTVVLDKEIDLDQIKADMAEREAEAEAKSAAAAEAKAAAAAKAEEEQAKAKETESAETPAEPAPAVEPAAEAEVEAPSEETREKPATEGEV